MKSLFALVLAVALSAEIATSVAAEPPTPTQAAMTPAAQLPVPTVQDAAVKAYNANLNPTAVIPSIGIYDQEDGRTGPTGTPLPGWGSLFGEGPGDN